MLIISNPYLFIFAVLVCSAVFTGVLYCNVLKRHSTIVSAESEASDMQCIKKVETQDISSEFRSDLYNSTSIVFVRLDMNARKLVAVNQAGASILGYETPDDAIENVNTYGQHLTPKSRAGLFSQLKKHKKVQNYPITCEINGTLHKMLVTAEAYENGKMEALAIDITEHIDIYEEIEDQYLFLQNILNALPMPIFVRDATHEHPFTNKAFKDTFDELGNGTLPEDAFLMFPHNAEEVIKDAVKLLKSGGASYETQFTTQHNGEIQHFEVQKRPLLGRNGDLFGVVGTSMDITKRKKVEEELRITTKQYRNLFWNAAEGITTVGNDGKLLEANPAMANMCGFENPEELLEEIPYIEMLWRHPEQRKEYLEHLIKNKLAMGYEFEFVRKDGSFGWMMLSSSATYDENGNFAHIESIVSDITLKKQCELELARCATIDSITGINNRNALEKHLRSLLAPSTAAAPFAVIFFDLNNFKPINDNYGHHTGDKVLQITAQRLVETCRDSDFAARLGGDEFVVVVDNVGCEAVLAQVTNKLLASIIEPITLNNNTHQISASAGCSRYPHDGTTMTDLLKAADASMYDMKRKSKASKINVQLERLANL